MPTNPDQTKLYLVVPDRRDGWLFHRIGAELRDQLADSLTAPLPDALQELMDRLDRIDALGDRPRLTA